jgi:hypothetical protein
MYEELVQSIVLPSEEVKVVLETLVLPPFTDNSPVLVSDRHKRVLAVVSRPQILPNNEQGWSVISQPHRRKAAKLPQFVHLQTQAITQRIDFRPFNRKRCPSGGGFFHINGSDKKKHN